MVYDARMSAPPSPPPEGRGSLTGLLLMLVLGAALLAWHLPDLGHPYLPGWDEAVHAAVAGGLARHPLTPTLFDPPFVPFDHRDWQANHVWLHMPPLPFWQASLGVALGGRSFFWLRLPSLLLLLAGLWLLYRLGTRLVGEPAALLGAALFGLAPFTWLQVQGYHFGDMTDVSLAFWLVAAFFCLERLLATGRLRWAALGGLAQAGALLSKSALGLAPLGAVTCVWLASRLGGRLGLRLPRPFGLSGLLTFLGLGLLPWQAWQLHARLRWPLESAHEAKALWAHVVSNYEGHGRPWDALFNDRLAHLFGPEVILWTLAGLGLLAHGARQARDGRRALLPLWILGTLLPLVLVQTKVPAILFGLAPALALGVGALLIRLARSGVGAAGLALLAAPTLAILVPAWTGLPGPATFQRLAPVFPDMAANPLLPPLLLAFLAAWPVLAGLGWLLGRLPTWTRHLRRAPGWLAAGLACLPFVWLLQEASRTRQGFEGLAGYNPIVPALEALGDACPPDPVFVIEGTTHGRQRPDLGLAFLTGRPAHLVPAAGLGPALRAGLKLGRPVLLTSLERQAEPLAEPRPGSGLRAYLAPDGEPPPPSLRPPEDGPALADWGRGPRLLRLVAGLERVRAGRGLPLLAEWRARGPAAAFETQILLVPVSGGEQLRPYPGPEAFPTGVQAVHLHNLAPPGLYWGARPLGNGLGEPHRLEPGQTLADGFHVVIPRHTPPGRYQVRLLLLEHAGSLPEAGPVADNAAAWPSVEVVPP